MLKISIIAACLGVISAYPYPVPVTQEQLAQYVAAQQTLGISGDDGKAQSVSILPRSRQAYSIPQHLYKQASADDAQEAAQQQHQQQRAIAYVAQPNAYPSAYSNPAPNAYSQQPAYSSSAQSISAYYQQSRQPQVQLDQSQLQALKKLRPAGATPSPETPEEDFDPNPQYQFSFDVKDDEFTNYHNRKEQREGDKISGSYSVVDSDGYIRTVTYTADPLQGFKAEVSRQPTDIKVKFPSPPTPVPQQYQQVDAHQGQSAHTLLARKQQTQQYLEAASPIDSASQQYSFRPQPAYSAVPQGLSPQAYAHPAPQKAVIPVGLGAYTGPHRLSPPQKPVKATAIGFASQTSTANPILYQAYQQ